MAKTMHDRFVAALEARGCTLLPRKNKYTMLQHGTDATKTYFVGKAGALRIARGHRNAATSRIANDKFKEALLSEVSA